jgi:hypothetical protein
LEPAGSHDSDVRKAAIQAVRYLAISGNAKEAVELATQLHEAWRDRLGPDHKDTLEMANSLDEAVQASGPDEQAPPDR